MDSTFTEYRYSDDGFNLLLEKKTLEGITITYSYLPETNLCTGEFHAYDGQIQERIFREYDENWASIPLH
jgi:hypothetical protein